MNTNAHAPSRADVAVTSTVTAFFLLAGAAAVSPASASPGEELPDKFFNSENPSLTPQE
ncbi:MAG: hypothetical protein H6R26_2562, partial [Proteobacteria bacterium]|nr:hypothetical protein [Pseudomonadota bacterium]